MTDEQCVEQDVKIERRERVAKSLCELMGWEYVQAPLFAGIRKVAICEACAVSVEKLEQIVERLKGLMS